MGVELAGGSDAAARAVFAAAIVAGGATFVPAALRNLVRGRLGVGLLMTIALFGAVLLGQFGEAASLAFLVSISEALEEWAVTRSRRGLRAVLALVPDTVRLRREAVVVEVPSADLVVGDRVVLWAGERLATDGVVDGRSSVDMSAVTGESIAVDVDVGAPRQPATARWRASCERSRRPRTARAAPSDSPTASPVQWCRPS